jgi:hypothetical protein
LESEFLFAKYPLCSWYFIGMGDQSHPHLQRKKVFTGIAVELPVTDKYR